MRLTRNLLPALAVGALFLGMGFAPAPADASATCNAERRACRQGTQWIFKGCKAQCRGDNQKKPELREPCYLGCENLRAAARPGCDDLRTDCRATVNASLDPMCANDCAPPFRQCVRDARAARKDALKACRQLARDGNDVCKAGPPPAKECKALVKKQLGVCLNNAGNTASNQVATLCIAPADTCVGASCPPAS